MANRYYVGLFGGLEEWVGPAPRRWVRTLTRCIVWMKEV
jgi:hypothetical protein